MLAQCIMRLSPGDADEPRLQTRSALETMCAFPYCYQSILQNLLGKPVIGGELKQIVEKRVLIASIQFAQCLTITRRDTPRNLPFVNGCGWLGIHTHTHPAALTRQCKLHVVLLSLQNIAK